MTWKDIIKNDKEMSKKLWDMQNQLMHNVGEKNMEKALKKHDESMKDLGEHDSVSKVTVSEFMQIIGQIAEGFGLLADKDDGWRGGGAYNIHEY